MTNEEYYLYISILSATIFVLSIGVGYFYIKLKTLKKLRDREIRHYLKKEQERVIFIKDSLKTIAMAFIQKQCEASEACIRLRMLIDRVDFIDNKEFPTLFKMYEEIRDFKTHEARSTLSSVAQKTEDKARFAIEEKYMDNLVDECKMLLSKLQVQ